MRTLRLQSAKKRFGLSCRFLPVFCALLPPLAKSLPASTSQQVAPQAATPMRPLLPLGEIILKAVKLVSGTGIFATAVTIKTSQRPNGSVVVEFIRSGSVTSPVEVLAEVRVSQLDEQTTWQVTIHEEQASATVTDKAIARRCDSVAEQMCTFIAEQRPLPKWFHLAVTADAHMKPGGTKNGFTILYLPSPSNLHAETFYRVSAEGKISKL